MRYVDDSAIFIKICGVTTADDALLAAGLGADAVGLNFAASPRRVSVARATEIVGRLPLDVLSIGIFRNESKERVVETAHRVGLRIVQLHGSETVEDTRWIGERIPNVIRALSIDHLERVNLDDYADTRLMIDAASPGSGQVFDWARLDELMGSRQYILAGGLDPENVGEAIEMVNPWGVDVATGVESSPGHKDPSKVRRFIAAARSAERIPGGLQVERDQTDGPFDWEDSA